MYPSLKGAKALIMASSSGLGKAVAEKLAANGTQVVITSRNQSNLDEAKADIVDPRNIPEDHILTAVCDLSDPDMIKDAVESVCEELGELDILITNHGGPGIKSFETATVEDLDQAYHEMVRSTFLVIKTAIPYYQRARAGQSPI